MSWQQDKRWSDRFIPEISSILGQNLIVQAPVEEDALRNSDLMVLKMDSVRIACRIRRNKDIDRYRDEFTVRYYRPSGNKTEFVKIIEGWGDYFFYGFCDPTETRLDRYSLLDLSVFRLSVQRSFFEGGRPWDQLKWNHDRSSAFAIFNISKFPEDLVMDSYPL